MVGEHDTRRGLHPHRPGVPGHRYAGAGGRLGPDPLTTGSTVVAPAAPTGLVAMAGNAQVALTWTAVNGATSYEVFCAGVPVATTTSPNYTETGLTNGTTYTFAVEATNGGGTSPASSTASATPEPAAPAHPPGSWPRPATPRWPSPGRRSTAPPPTPCSRTARR